MCRYPNRSSFSSSTAQHREIVLQLRLLDARRSPKDRGQSRPQYYQTVHLKVRNRTKGGSAPGQAQILPAPWLVSNDDHRCVEFEQFSISPSRDRVEFVPGCRATRRSPSCLNSSSKQMRKVRSQKEFERANDCCWKALVDHRCALSEG